jgi:leucyl-tRNA synthetase
MLHERGLAYQAESLVNWDPVDQTVLANEQVDANGNSWRSGAKVEKKMLNQWFLKIKQFQEPLLKDLDSLAEGGRWPERVLAMQRNWIGQSVGTKLWFDIHTLAKETTDSEATDAKPTSAPSAPSFGPVEVFTTRADTLLGVMYVALSLNHPIVQALAKDDEALRNFLERAKDSPPGSKQGYLLRGVKAKNPIAGHVSDTRLVESVPVFVAPYVLDDYGSGAVMGVPAHDSRDYAFWRQHLGNEPIHHVITAEQGRTIDVDKPMLEQGKALSSDQGLNGLPSNQAAEEIVKRLEAAGRPVERTENWRLRDWLVSRQRYWGTPIPIVHCNSCGPVPVPDDQLPVVLPDIPASHFKERTGNPLAKDESWKETKCPRCHSPAKRETDTMDTFMDSSWYFFRFLDPKNENELVTLTEANKHMPVDVYVGGVEHAILHLLYARFISKFVATTTLWPAGKNVLGEPFRKLITQGMVHGKTYTDPVTGRFLRPEEVGLGPTPLIKGTEIVPNVSYEKMSKSKHNGVDPGATIAKYGADATRAHMLFQAPVGDVLEWDEQKIAGVQRWLARVQRLSFAFWWPKAELERGFVPPYDIDVGIVAMLAGLRKIEYLPEAPQLFNQPSRYGTEVEELIGALKPPEAELISTVQKTIASVTKSYSETYSLNTVVSDLMTLTNAIWDTPHASICTSWFKWYATVHLLRMLAPIAPGAAEKNWQSLHRLTNSRVRNDALHPLRRYEESRPGPSIFTFGFPTANIDILPLLNPKVTCVVQFDGKKKLEILINEVSNSIQNAEDEVIKKHVVGQILESESGKLYLGNLAKSTWRAEWPLGPEEFLKHMPPGWKIVVAKRGRIVNISSPKKRKMKREHGEAQGVWEPEHKPFVAPPGKRVDNALHRCGSEEAEDVGEPEHKPFIGPPSQEVDNVLHGSTTRQARDTAVSATTSPRLPVQKHGSPASESEHLVKVRGLETNGKPSKIDEIIVKALDGRDARPRMTDQGEKQVKHDVYDEMLNMRKGVKRLEELKHIDAEIRRIEQLGKRMLQEKQQHNDAKMDNEQPDVTVGQSRMKRVRDRVPVEQSNVQDERTRIREQKKMVQDAKGKLQGQLDGMAKTTSSQDGNCKTGHPVTRFQNNFSDIAPRTRPLVRSVSSPFPADSTRAGNRSEHAPPAPDLPRWKQKVEKKKRLKHSWEHRGKRKGKKLGG